MRIKDYIFLYNTLAFVLVNLICLLVAKNLRKKQDESTKLIGKKAFIGEWQGLGLLFEVVMENAPGK